jgi:hypothetical protein
MDKKPAVGNRIHFRKIFTTTPVLLAPGAERNQIVFVNETASAVRVGLSGTVATLGMYLGSGVLFTDDYTRDEWWAVTSSGSGTISGFVVP